jgi:cell division protein FtsZ
MTTRREILLAALADSALYPNAIAVAQGLPTSAPTPESDALRAKPSGIELVNIADEEFNTGIRVMGVGGGGCQTVRFMIDQQVQGIEFACVDTDLMALVDHAACKTIQLGASGFSTNGQQAIARDAALGSADDIRAALKNADLLFIVTGLGGGTGSGAAPVIAELAQKMGILTVGIVTMPFEFEGNSRMANAQAGLIELRANTSTLCVMPAEKIAGTLGKGTTPVQTFDHFNTLVIHAVGGMTTAVHGLNFVSEGNRDFLAMQWSDVFTNLYQPGQAMLVTAVAKGAERARLAAEQIIASPWLPLKNLAHAKGLIVLCAGTKDALQSWESKLAMNTIRAAVSPEAHVLYFTTMTKV